MNPCESVRIRARIAVISARFPLSVHGFITKIASRGEGCGNTFFVFPLDSINPCTDRGIRVRFPGSVHAFIIISICGFLGSFLHFVCQIMRLL